MVPLQQPSDGAAAATKTASEHLTSPLTVRADLRNRSSAQRWAATHSHGGGLVGSLAFD
jgi:hypothetical protein